MFHSRVHFVNFKISSKWPPSSWTQNAGFLHEINRNPQWCISRNFSCKGFCHHLHSNSFKNHQKGNIMLLCNSKCVIKCILHFGWRVLLNQPNLLSHFGGFYHLEKSWNFGDIKIFGDIKTGFWFLYPRKTGFWFLYHRFVCISQTLCARLLRNC